MGNPNGDLALPILVRELDKRGINKQGLTRRILNAPPPPRAGQGATGSQNTPSLQPGSHGLLGWGQHDLPLGSESLVASSLCRVAHTWRARLL